MLKSSCKHSVHSCPAQGAWTVWVLGENLWVWTALGWTSCCCSYLSCKAKFFSGMISMASSDKNGQHLLLIFVQSCSILFMTAAWEHDCSGEFLHFFRVLKTNSGIFSAVKQWSIQLWFFSSKFFLFLFRMKGLSWWKTLNSNLELLKGTAKVLILALKTCKEMMIQTLWRR